MISERAYVTMMWSNIKMSFIRRVKFHHCIPSWFHVTYLGRKYMLGKHRPDIWIYPCFSFTPDQFHEPCWLKSLHYNRVLTPPCFTECCQGDTFLRMLKLTSGLSYECLSDINYALTHWVIGRSLVDVLVHVNEELSVVGGEFQVLAIFPTRCHHKFIQHKESQKQITSAKNNQLT